MKQIIAIIYIQYDGYRFEEFWDVADTIEEARVKAKRLRETKKVRLSDACTITYENLPIKEYAAEDEPDGEEAHLWLKTINYH